MQIISVKNLNKEFRTKIKKEGFMGSVRSVVKPELKLVQAVKDITSVLIKARSLRS